MGQRKCLASDLPARITPANFTSQRLINLSGSQTKMQLGAALARVAITSVNLGDELPSIRQIDGGGCSDRGPAQSIRARMTRARPRFARVVCVEREQKMKSQKLSATFAFVMIKIGRLPLISDDEVECAIAVDIRHGDSATDVRLTESKFDGQIVITPVFGTHKERVVLMAA